MHGFVVWSAAFAVGAVALRLAVVTSRDLMHSRSLARENYRGATLPTAGGLLIVLVVLAVEAGRAVFGAIGLGHDTGITIERSLVLFAVVGYGLLGFVDDTLGDSSTSGYVGHVRAALSGRLTTGFVKFAGGGALAVALVATPGFRSGSRLVVDALLIALSANLANLLDRAPGRTLKVATVAYIPLALVVGSSAIGVAVAVVMGAAIAFMPEDLGERLMLGDTGANPIGAVLALGVVFGTSFRVRVVCLVVVGLLNIAAERWSFSAVIDRVGALRVLDRAGRRDL